MPVTARQQTSTCNEGCVRTEKLAEVHTAVLPGNVVLVHLLNSEANGILIVRCHHHLRSLYVLKDCVKHFVIVVVRILNRGEDWVLVTVLEVKTV